MEFTVGTVVEGKVTGITKFGAFVSLPGNKTGMVHISEIAHAYVSDINEFLTIGQEVKAMIIAIDEQTGKINLSIKKTIDPPARQNRNDRQGYQNRGDRGGYQNRNDRQGYQNRNDRGDRGDRNDRNDRNDRSAQSSGDRPQRQQNGGRSYNQNRQGGRSSASKEPQSFDDMLKQFMADSDSNLSSNKMYADHRTKSKRRQ